MNPYLIGKGFLAPAFRFSKAANILPQARTDIHAQLKTLMLGYARSRVDSVRWLGIKISGAQNLFLMQAAGLPAVANALILTEIMT